MSTKDITPKFITSMLKCFVNSQSKKYHVWQPNTKVTEGQIRLSSDKLYLASTGGVTGNSTPVHTSGKASDGTVTWYYIGTHLAEHELGANLHLGLGGRGEWLNNTPQTLTNVDDGEVLDQLYAALRLNLDDMSIGCKRNKWVASTVYDQWPATMSYVNVGDNIYRCIDNNNGAESTIEPSFSGTKPFESTDGYIWQYIGSVDSILNDKYGSDDVFPVVTLAAPSTETWNVQQAAKHGSISGFKVLEKAGAFTATPSITIVGDGTGATAGVTLDNATNELKRVYAINGGEGYKYANTFAVIAASNATGQNGAITASVGVDGTITGLTIDHIGEAYTTVKLMIVGDGTGATATADVIGGYLTNATVTNAGTGYTWAKVFVIPGDNYCVAKAVLAPNGGHGADLVKELPCNVLLVNKKVTSLDMPYVTIDHLYKQITLLSGLGNYDRLAGTLNATADLVKADIGKARVLFVSNITPIKLTSTDDCVIKLSLEFI